MVETLKPREEDDSDTSTDDDDENLNADDWLARSPDHRKAPVPTEAVEDVSPYALVAYNALAVWRWFFVFCWCSRRRLERCPGLLGMELHP